MSMSGLDHPDFGSRHNHARGAHHFFLSEGSGLGAKGTAMEHKAVQFKVVQTTNPYCWKWIVFLDANRMLTGIALTRADAILDAELAIEKVLERKSCRDELIQRRTG